MRFLGCWFFLLPKLPNFPRKLSAGFGGGLVDSSSKSSNAPKPCFFLLSLLEIMECSESVGFCFLFFFGRGISGTGGFFFLFSSSRAFFLASVSCRARSSSLSACSLCSINLFSCSLTSEPNSPLSFEDSLTSISSAAYGSEGILYGLS